MLSELLIAVFLILFFMVWAVTLALAFVGGVLYKNKKRKLTEPQKPTEMDIRKAKRMQKEVENFMTYSGIPQEAINDYE